MTIVLNHEGGHYYAEWGDDNSEMLLNHLIGQYKFTGGQYLEDVRLLAAAHGWCVSVNEIKKEN